MNNLATKSELLRNLKGTAEGLLAVGTYNVWNTCGGRLERFSSNRFISPLCWLR